MTTRIRLPTAPIPDPSPEPELGTGPLPGLAGFLRARNEGSTIARRVAALRGRCAEVLVVDDGSQDDTATQATKAGARVLRFPTPRGEGPALRAGLRLLRELGFIGAVLPLGVDLPASDLERLATAFLRAPEAMLLGVGPGEAIAGTEWAEAAALARGETPRPVPEFRPPMPEGIPGLADRAFRRLAETRFSHPWGGPRVLPLQGILRQRWDEDGPAVHLEMLAAALLAGIPTVEVELSQSPPRAVVPCKKPALRLIARWVPAVVSRRVVEALGIGGGYSPPTTSPLGLALAFLSIWLTACVHHPAAPTVAACPDGFGQAEWPGQGEADAAWAEFRTARLSVPVAWAEQDVTVTDPALGHQRLRGVTVQQGTTRWRMRLLLPLGLTALDYVRADGRWELSVPGAGLHRLGLDGEPLPREDRAQLERWGGLDPARMAGLLGAPPEHPAVRWGAGCAVLEALDGDAVGRRLGWTREGERWVVSREELLEGGQVILQLDHGDWRPVGEGLWPHRTVVVLPARQSRIELVTTSLRTDGVQDAFFAFSS